MTSINAPTANAVPSSVATLNATQGVRLEEGITELPSISPTRLAEAQHDHAIDLSTFEAQVTSDSNAAQTILYLAYGSNLCAKTFKGMRHIKPISELNVVVPEIRLTFDLPGIPYVEPCFANVQYREGSQDAKTEGDESLRLLPRPQGYRKDDWKKGLVGVVYEVSREDFATIIKTEGGGASYADVVVDCHPLSDTSKIPDAPTTKSFKAHTLFCPCEADIEKYGQKDSSTSGGVYRPKLGYAQASARYMKLLTDGADEHRLPQEYRDYLVSIRAYTMTQKRQRVGKIIMTTVWYPIIMTMFMFHRRFANEKGQIPPWATKVTQAVFKGMWFSYDYVLKPLFGDGERTITNSAAS